MLIGTPAYTTQLEQAHNAMWHAEALLEERDFDSEDEEEDVEEDEDFDSEHGDLESVTTRVSNLNEAIEQESESDEDL